jgi:hypothetical protein
VARYVNNIFFKLKKLQTQVVTHNKNVAVCKQTNKKQVAKIVRAGQFKDQGNIEKLILKHTKH